MGAGLNTADRMAAAWEHGFLAGTAETACGPGSTLQATAGLRAWLADVLPRYRIGRLNDAGCGDRNWIRSVPVPDYAGYDVVPAPGAQCADITRECMRPADAVLCRSVLIHLDVPDCQRALQLFRASARYLIADTCPGAPLKAGTEGPLDLAAAPFNLGPPLEATPETDAGRLLALWSLAAPCRQ